MTPTATPRNRVGARWIHDGIVPARGGRESGVHTVQPVPLNCERPVTNPAPVFPDPQLSAYVQTLLFRSAPEGVEVK